MRVEVSIAVNFVLSFLYNRLPRRRVNLIGEHLFGALTAKFQGHWYPEQPMKGTAFRCLKICGEQSDPLIVDAARETGLDAAEVTQHLPQNLTLWVDPGEVSCRVGEKGPVTQLYSSANADSAFQQAQQVQQLFMPLSATEPQSWPEPAAAPQHGAGSCFTAATFAQTKFGSTKLRQPPRSAMRQPRSQHQQPWGSYGSGYGGGGQLSVAIPGQVANGNAAMTGGYGSDGSSGHSSPLMMFMK